MARIAVVIPTHKAVLRPQELIAVAQARKHLGGFDCYVLHPMGRPPPFDTAPFRLMPLSPRRFRSVTAYNRMMLSPRFWARFADYDNVLVYQLDALVFSSDFAPWCRFSYVGAPWISSRSAFRPKAVGNSGFSLRSVKDHRAVLASRRVRLVPRDRQILTYLRRPKYLFRWLGRLLLARWRAWRDGRPAGTHLARRFAENDDVFWSYYAPQLLDGFRLPSPEEALRFSFERRPQSAYERIGRQLPVGCHAWYKFDEAFWRGFLG